jgi:hypothetical protein
LGSSLWARVTRLGEFSPNGRLFTLGSFFNNYINSPQFWATFSNVYQDYICINFDKNWVGLHFGSFFQKLIWSHCLYLSTNVQRNSCDQCYKKLGRQLDRKTNLWKTR